MSETTAAVTVEDISPVKKKLSFDVPWSEVKKEMDAVYRKISNTASVKGFRKGKVPRHILENLYKEVAEREAAANMIEKLYGDALRSKEVNAVCQPSIEQQGIEAEKSYSFSATVEVEPAIEPKDYVGLQLEIPARDVTEKDVDARLEDYRQRFATLEETTEDRKVAVGDCVILDFTGTINGVSMKELAAENSFVEIGANRFIPGFEEQVVGAGKDETKDITVRFPDDYHAKDVAGKDAVFTVTVKNIKEKKIPALDDAFISNFEQFSSLEELREDIRQKLHEINDRRSQTEVQNALVNELLKHNEFEVPECYVEREYQYIVADIRRRMAMDGLPKDKLEELLEKYRDDYWQRAVRSVKVAGLLNSIAAKETITVSEAEVDERADEIVAQSADYEREDMKKYLEERAVRMNLRGEISHKKVFQFLEDNAKITKVPAEEKHEEESK